MNYIYGSLKSLVPDTGLLVGDFSLYNNTTASSVTITSVTESPDGTYTFVIPTQTSADVMVLTPSKDGRSHTPDEYSSPESLVEGAQVLLDAVLELDKT